MKAGASPLFLSAWMLSHMPLLRSGDFILNAIVTFCNTAHTEEAVLRRGPLRPTLSAALAASDAVCFRGYKTRQLC